jgi:hypothetical protein
MVSAVVVLLLLNGGAIDADLGDVHIIAGEEDFGVVQDQVELDRAFSLLPVELQTDSVLAGAGDLSVGGLDAGFGRGLVNALVLGPPGEIVLIGLAVLALMKKPVNIPFINKLFD